MALEASEARNRMAEAILSGLATRFIGVISIQVGKRSGSVKLVFDIGVST